MSDNVVIVVSPGPQGIQGPQGPIGPPGSGGVITTFVFTQSSASASWLIVHNLGQYPSVTVVDSAGTLVDGDITYLDANTVRIDFSAAFGGKAYLN